MRVIRGDFEGGIWAHPRDQNGHVAGDAVWLVAGSEVPESVLVSPEHLDGAAAKPDPGPVAPAVPDGFFDPSELTVDEVNTALENASDDVIRAVVDAEAGGRKRGGVLTGPAARRLPH